MGVVGSVVALAATAVFAVTLRVAQLVITPPTARAEDVTILRVNRRAGTVTLSDHPDAVTPGRYSLYFGSDRGYAKVGEIQSFGDGSVTRILLAEERGVLRAGRSARISGWFYESPAELGEAYSEVDLDTEFGSAPAWMVPAESPQRWAIQVHGRGVDRREPIRSIPVFHEAGYNALLVSYRNDGVAPASPDGRYALGDTEWRDVEAGIRYAVAHGATEVVLMGWSMGGAIVLQAATRTGLAEYLSGVVLDSPVIDWVRVLEHQAASMGIPRAISFAVFRMISSPLGRRFTGQSAAIDLERLDFVDRAAELNLPILLMHSDSDSYVPSAGSRALARLRPDIVTFESFAGAGHTRLWNYDSARWNSVIAAWLVGRAPTRPSSP